MTILRKEDQEFLNKVKSGNNKPVVNTTPKQESLSERIDNKLAEMSQKSPVIGKFFVTSLLIYCLFFLLMGRILTLPSLLRALN